MLVNTVSKFKKRFKKARPVSKALLPYCPSTERHVYTNFQSSRLPLDDGDASEASTDAIVSDAPSMPINVEPALGLKELVPGVDPIVEYV